MWIPYSLLTPHALACTAMVLTGATLMAVSNRKTRRILAAMALIVTGFLSAASTPSSLPLTLISFWMITRVTNRT